MGQKVNPIIFRITANKNWRSMWFANKKDYLLFLSEDFKIRDFLKKRLASAAVARVVIERATNRLRVNIHSARPGLIIGRKGADLDGLKRDVANLTHASEVAVDVKEIKNPELEPQLVAENIALQLERRISFRRAMKKAVQTAMDFGADGVRVRCSGRLGGSEIARTEQYRLGRVPLHTIRANVDYGFAEAHTPAGLIGVKCWICRKDEGPAARLGR
ncbi:MAG TPA: 30S ribosomal protein S3 [Verrucomicrobiae bacterium]|nr:30S ribosomal protein S3 [Verrucomicrobiae bacterium]